MVAVDETEETNLETHIERNLPARREQTTNLKTNLTANKTTNLMAPKQALIFSHQKQEEPTFLRQN